MTNKGEPKNKNTGHAETDALDSGGSPVFLLEDIYPDASSLFAPSHVPLAGEADTLVSFDTNALLLPYNIGSQDLTALAKVLKDLAEANRLFVAGRVAREFIKNRDRKLADMLKALRDKASRVQLPEQKLSPLLDGVEGYEDVTAASEKLASAWREYRKAQDKILARMRDWRGTDPVSLVYSEVLSNGRIVELDESREALLKEWDTRRTNRTPPGYKDSGKDDSGIGDFLIWKVLLKLGTTHKKDLIFITGEEKADWFVRSDSERVYPRPELVDEYRRASGGRSIRLATLAEVLAEMNAPATVVDEVKAAEQTTDDWIDVILDGPTAKDHRNLHKSLTVRRMNSKADMCTFDYSTRDGKVTVETGDRRMTLRFSKADRSSIHLYRDGTTTRIARVKDNPRGRPLEINDFDTSSTSYTIKTGENFMAENEDGDILVGWLAHVRDESRGDMEDEVQFAYHIFGPGESPAGL